jgi:hydrogenase maturation protease
MKKTLVLGLGNILLRDEGVGVRVVERLQERYKFPSDVELLDGGTLGLDLMGYVEAADRVLVFDALDLGAEPGTLGRLEGEEVPAFLSIKISPHQMGLSDLLAAARLREVYPEEIVLLGAQPATIDVGLELSPVVAAQVDALVDKAVTELRRWGIELWLTDRAGAQRSQKAVAKLHQ